MVDALKKEPGVSEAAVENDKQPITVLVRFDSTVTDLQRLGRKSKQALESDPQNLLPVDLIFDPPIK